MSAPVDSLQIGMHWFGERPGGLDRMFKALIETLPSQGVNVRGLVAGSSRVLADTGGVVHTFAEAQEPIFARLWKARRQSAALKHARLPDIVASHFALYAAPTSGVFRGVPNVIHFHGPWADESAVEGRKGVSRMMRGMLERFVYRGGSRHIVLSSAFGQILQTNYGVPEHSIRVVPGCVDVDRFDPHVTQGEARRTLGLPLDRPVLLCVRRLVSRMGLEDLIDAMFYVRQRVPDVMLIIVGKGALEEALRKRVEGRGLAKSVRLTGFVPDEQLPLYYRAANLSVVPSVSLEGFGLTSVESLAAGTPVLVTPIGGLPEAVAPLAPNLVLPSTGTHALDGGIVEALLGQISLPDANACMHYARTRFSQSVVAGQVAAVYRETIDAH